MGRENAGRDLPMAEPQPNSRQAPPRTDPHPLPDQATLEPQQHPATEPSNATLRPARTLTNARPRPLPSSVKPAPDCADRAKPASRAADGVVTARDELRAPAAHMGGLGGQRPSRTIARRGPPPHDGDGPLSSLCDARSVGPGPRRTRSAPLRAAPSTRPGRTASPLGIEPSLDQISQQHGRA